MVQDARNFKYSSDYPMPYFVYKTTKEIQVNAKSSASIEFNHDLNFIPLLIGYWSESEDFDSTNDINNPVLGDNYASISVVANNNSIKISASNSANSSKKFYVRLWGYMPPDSNSSSTPVFDTTRYFFDTDYDYLELAKYGTAMRTGSPIEIVHNLGYIPQCRVWRKYAIEGIEYIEPAMATLFPDEIYAQNASFWATDKILHLGGLPSNAICYYYHIYTSEG